MFSKITEADLNNKGVSGLPDTPNLSTSEMQAKFDELSKDVIVPKFNNLVEELSAQSASENIGITPPEKFTGDTIKSLIYEIIEIVLSNQSKSHEHSNKGILDGITDQNLLDLDNLVNLFSGISTVASVVSDSLAEIPNSHAIVEYMTQLGSGDMQKAIYDKDNSGVVDDAEKLGGLSAESYQKVLESSLQTENKTIPSAINELADSLSNMSIKQGDLAELQTSVKSSIVSAINEVLGSIPKMLSTLEEVDANTESGKVADALTLKEVNRNLQADNGQQFQFAYDTESGKYGYKAKVEGADTFFPFSSAGSIRVETYIQSVMHSWAYYKTVTKIYYNDVLIATFESEEISYNSVPQGGTACRIDQTIDLSEYS